MPATRVWAPHRIRIEALHQTAKQPDKVQLADLGGTTSRVERGRRPAGRIGAPLGGPPSLAQAASPSPTDQFFVQGLVPTVRVVFGFGRLAWWPGSLRGAAQASRSHHLVYRSFASWGRRPPGQRGGTGLGPTRRRRAWAAQRYRQSPGAVLPREDAAWVYKRDCGPMRVARPHLDQDATKPHPDATKPVSALSKCAAGSRHQSIGRGAAVFPQARSWHSPMRPRRR
jgi:hypothetical protein